jgi:hypothetical protein
MATVMLKGMIIVHRTRTRETRQQQTAVLPVPVRFPTQIESGIPGDSPWASATTDTAQVLAYNCF